MRTHSQLKAGEEFHGDEDNNDHKNDEKMKKKILQNPSSCFLATLSLNWKVFMARKIARD